MAINKSLYLLSLLSLALDASPTTSFAPLQLQWTANSQSPLFALDNNVRPFMKEDGNFIIYDGANNVLWQSGTDGRNCGAGNCYMIFQTDGNLVLYEHDVTGDLGSPVTGYWSTSTQVYPGHSDQAQQVLFRNTAPYVEMYDANGYLEWETEGASGSQLFNPALPPPCSGGVCEGGCEVRKRCIPPSRFKRL